MTPVLVKFVSIKEKNSGSISKSSAGIKNVFQNTHILSPI